MKIYRVPGHADATETSPGWICRIPPADRRRVLSELWRRRAKRQMALLRRRRNKK